MKLKNIFKVPKDKWEAIALLNESQQHLLNAIFIIESMLENNTEEFKESHERRMMDFIKNFK